MSTDPSTASAGGVQTAPIKIEEDIAVREHYRQIRPVLEALATVGDRPTMAVPDKHGWYVLKRNADPSSCAEWQFQRRARWLDRDLNSTIRTVDRCLYALTSWKDPAVTDDWRLAQKRDGTWLHKDGQTPTPDARDITALSIWGDIDLADALKQRRGALTESERSIIEQTLQEYAVEFGRLYGDREPIYMLDSVGGAYIMGAPEATLPIADHFDEDPDARARVFQAFIDRSNAWLEAAQERVENRVTGVDGLLDPDWVNNINRAYKTPLSIHATHDAVVCPMDSAEPTLDVTTVDDVDVVLIEETKTWAADLTAIQYADRVEHIVAQLWPEYFLEREDWRAALDAWVQDQRAAEEPATGGASNTSCNHESRGRLTTDIAVTQAALDRIDGEVVAERTIVHRWTDSKPGVQDNSGDGKRAFVPVWGPSAEGTANYIDRASNTWTDTGADDHGTVVEMALIDRENWPRGEIAAGEDWGRGVTHLQRLGFAVPVWTPDATTQCYTEMPWWAVRRAAVVLNVVDEDEVISNPAPEDETSFGLPSRESFNRALEAIEAVGLVHNREPFLGGD